MSCVLVTGATGFVGGATAFRLLADARVDRLVLLGRPTRAGTSKERLQQSLGRFGKISAEWRRVTVVEGDLGAMRIGDDLLGKLTHVVHAAASTSFGADPEIRRTNVLGTQALVEALAGAGRLERFLHVSTAYRCGAEAARVVRDEHASSPTHVVDYTKSKAEIEAWLEHQRRLPMVIARPSVVIGHSRLGVRPSSSLYWYYRALAAAGIAPFTSYRHRDVVPVDYVADALVHLLFLPDPRYRHFHISAGEVSSDTWGDIHRTFGLAPSTLVVVPELLAKHPVWKRLVSGDRRFLRALDLCSRFATIPVEWFSNERLLESGMSAPPRFTSYLPRCSETGDRDLSELLVDEG